MNTLSNKLGEPSSQTLIYRHDYKYNNSNTLYRSCLTSRKISFNIQIVVHILINM